MAFSLTVREAEENRRVCVDMVKGRPENLVSSIKKLAVGSSSLNKWIQGAQSSLDYVSSEMPRCLDWKIFNTLYDVQPRNYEEPLSFKGVGSAVVRTLALTAQIIYGVPVSWRDPAKFTYALGGKGWSAVSHRQDDIG